jgi:hypothetical protein
MCSFRQLSVGLAGAHGSGCDSANNADQLTFSLPLSLALMQAGIPEQPSLRTGAGRKGLHGTVSGGEQSHVILGQAHI